MVSRRDFLQMAMATTALYGASGFGKWGKLSAQQAMSQEKLLEFDTFGNVSLIHVTDIHAQLKPIYFREPEINIGVVTIKERYHISRVPIFGSFMALSKTVGRLMRSVAKILHL